MTFTIILFPYWKLEETVGLMVKYSYIPAMPNALSVELEILIAPMNVVVPTATGPSNMELPVVRKLAICIFPVPVAFVNVNPCKDEVPETVKYPEAVILVEETLVEETVDTVNVVPVALVKRRPGNRP